MSDTPLLTLDNLSIAFGALQVVKGVTLSVPRGGAVALVGESGSGKSVTARAVSGLLGRIGGRIVSGRVTFDGEDLARASEADWHRLRGDRIALVPQASLSSLDPVIRLGAQVTETIRQLTPDANAEARAIELFEQVQLPRPKALLRAYPHELSGGMRQRVMIALALAGRPEFIIADEPTTALDVTVQKEILSLLTEIRRETGMSLLLIAHDLAVVSEVVDSVSVMRAGELVESGAATKVLSTPDHRYTRALLAAQPSGTENGRPLAVLDRETGELRTPSWDAGPERGEGRPILEARGLSVTYPGAETPSLAPLDLTVTAGASLGIVGESGSGKSTLGKALVGAQGFDGTLMLEGRKWDDIARTDPLRRKVQMIFQDPYGSLTPWRTPRRIVAEVLRNWTPMSRAEARDKAGDLLVEVGLPREAMDRPPADLSGGQCQRVGIARALACDPDVLVADEPTSSLDISTQAQILNLILRLRAERGLTLILISHDLAVIRHMTDRALVMRSGEVVEQGPCEQIFERPEHAYTRQLIASTPKIRHAS